MRYRDENGKLTKSIKEIAQLTQAEGLEYYQVGQKYCYAETFKIYTLVGNDGVLMQFKADDADLFIPADLCGTFLPGVADNDGEIYKVGIEA